MNFTFAASPETFTQLSIVLNGPTAADSDYDLFLASMRSSSFVQGACDWDDPYQSYRHVLNLRN